MKETWRLVLDPALEGSRNMAIDYAIMKALSEGASTPTLRLYEWAPPAITIGYFQVIEDEINVEACARDSVPIIRRVTGGGAVLHQYEITYSVVLPLKSRIACSSILDSYRMLCDPIVSALSAMGMNAQFSPVNDILVNGKKISGSAQTRRFRVLLQHGTILLDVDRERMFRYLRVAKEKYAQWGAEPAERVVSASHLLGKRAMSGQFRDSLIAAITNAYADAFDVEFRNDVINEVEREHAARAQQIFSSDEWNRNRKARL